MRASMLVNFLPYFYFCNKFYKVEEITEKIRKIGSIFRAKYQNLLKMSGPINILARTMTKERELRRKRYFYLNLYLQKQYTYTVEIIDLDTGEKQLLVGNYVNLL